MCVFFASFKIKINPKRKKNFTLCVRTTHTLCALIQYYECGKFWYLWNIKYLGRTGRLSIPMLVHVWFDVTYSYTYARTSHHITRHITSHANVLTTKNILFNLFVSKYSSAISFPIWIYNIFAGGMSRLCIRYKFDIPNLFAYFFRIPLSYLQSLRRNISNPLYTTSLQFAFIGRNYFLRYTRSCALESKRNY